jgi:hypothetical protein
MPSGARPLFFVHVPKTAGTSFFGLVGARFAPARTLPLYDMTPDEAEPALQHLERFDFVHGHVPVDMRRLFPTRPFVVTMLRDPLERALSSFHYLRSDAVPGPDARHAWARAGALAKRTTLAGFIRDDAVAAGWHLGNLQVRMLSQAHGPEWFDADRFAWAPLDRADLDRACETLVACDAFGLTERMPESIELLSHALRTAVIGYPGRANRTIGRPALQAIDPEARTLLEELTEHDRALYRFGAELFERRRRDMLRVLLAGQAAGQPARDDAAATGGASVFLFDGPIPGEGWYATERTRGITFGWTGPERESWLILRSPPDGEGARLEVDVMHALMPEQLRLTTLLVNDWPVPREISVGATGHRLEATVPAWLLRPPGEANRIGLVVDRVARPCDVVPGNIDSRLLGLAISRVALIAGP